MKSWEKINREDKTYSPEVTKKIMELKDRGANVQIKNADGSFENGWKITRLGYDDEYKLVVAVKNKDGTRIMKFNPDEFLEWQGK